MSATDKDLGALHKEVAKTLTKAVAVIEGEDGPVLPPAAFLGAAIAFLKNNNITADVTTNAELAALEDTLKQRRNKRLSAADLAEAAAQFERANGDFMQ
jgi:hypothetical protein